MHAIIAYVGVEVKLHTTHSEFRRYMEMCGHCMCVRTYVRQPILPHIQCALAHSFQIMRHAWNPAVTAHIWNRPHFAVNIPSQFMSLYIQHFDLHPLFLISISSLLNNEESFRTSWTVVARPRDEQIRVPIPVKARYISLLQTVPRGSEGRPAYHSVGTGVVSRG